MRSGRLWLSLLVHLGIGELAKDLWLSITARDRPLVQHQRSPGDAAGATSVPAGVTTEDGEQVVAVARPVGRCVDRPRRPRAAGSDAHLVRLPLAPRHHAWESCEPR